MESNDEMILIKSSHSKLYNIPMKLFYWYKLYLIYFNVEEENSLIGLRKTLKIFNAPSVNIFS